MLPLVLLAVRNQEAFGAFWKTGYSLSGEQTAFDLLSLLKHSLPYVGVLLAQSAVIVFVLGVAGIRRLFLDPDTRPWGVLLAALVIPITLVYMAYYWMPSFRFVLPTFFIYAIAAAWFLQILSQRQPARARNLAAWSLALASLVGLPLSVLLLGQLKNDNAPLATITHALQRHAEPGSLVIADGGINQHLDYIGKWRLARAEASHSDPGPPSEPDKPARFPPRHPPVDRRPCLHLLDRRQARPRRLQTPPRSR